MKKIICDVCGTSYQESAGCCPICGCTRDEAIILGEEFPMDDSSASGNRYPNKRNPAGVNRTVQGNARPGHFSNKKKPIFDFDEVNVRSNDNRTQEVYYDEEAPASSHTRYSIPAVVVLTVLIVVLVLLVGFFFFRFLLPGNAPQETAAATETQIQETTQATEALYVPCQSLALTSGTAELTTEGAFFLINVSVYPENTTDKLIYHSADSSIATVDDSGRITAVSQGNTVVYVTCGAQQIPCEVVCSFAPETEEATQQTVPEESVNPEETGVDAASETDPETTEETVPETTEETVPETTEAEVQEVELKLKKTDIILNVGTYFTLKLDCDLDPEDVEWSSEHTYIARVDEKGVVTAVGKGITEITVTYGDQTASCIVRCKSN